MPYQNRRGRHAAAFLCILSWHIVKITSRILCRELRDQLGPTMKGAGFKNLKGGVPGWLRPAAGGHLALWFQADKWGWSELWGSRFTVEFQITPEPGDAMTGKGRSERIGYLLEGFAELDELRLNNNSVIEKLPGTVNGRLAVTKVDDGTELVVEGYKVDPDKAVYGRDLWMHYYSLDDVHMWGDYFTHKLPRFISLFENETRSAEGEASIRFHRMMGRVQSSKELLEKAAILGEFIKTENDAHYRAAAEHWLNEVAKIRTDRT
jgi:hypothetical protein